MKDTAEVINFMSLYGRLIGLDLEPLELEDISQSDEKIRELCINLHFAAWTLRLSERHDLDIFTGPSDPKFINQFRDFENRFEQTINEVWFGGVDLGTGREEASASKLPTHLKAKRQWEMADENALEKAKAIEGALDFAADQATQDHRGFPDGFADEIADAVLAWEETRKSSGLSLRGMLRRRQLVPFTLIPRHVHEKFGASGKLSLFSLLREAQNCFVFGSFLASFIVMRGIVEQVLRDHYKAGDADTNLDKRIDLCVGLPSLANKSALHNLRIIANSVAHSNEGESHRLKDKDRSAFELQISWFMSVVRALIEGAPVSTAQQTAARLA